MFNYKRFLIITLSIVIVILIVLLSIEIINSNKFSDNSLQTVPKPQNNLKANIKGVWVASVYNIDFPSRPNLSNNELMKELDNILDITSQSGLNTIFFQVRPCGDALYNSEIFPVSQYLTGIQGVKNEIFFDPLQYLIEIAHSKGIRVEAWINPYRITAYSENSKSELIDSLSTNNPAKQNPDWAVEYNGKLFYNPGIPEVRELIVSGVKEIIENYDVDGIHFDDYFYPYPVYEKDNQILEFNDKNEFELYNPNGLSLADWRRENVNMLIKNVYHTIKNYDDKISFGVSPFGVWANSSQNPLGSDTNDVQSYYDLYCDPISWIKGGYIDYICPQIYWSFLSSSCPYDVLVKWWNDQVDGTSVDLYIGHALYKIEDFSLNHQEIIAQIQYARTFDNYNGSVFYGFSILKNNSYNIVNVFKEYYN